MPAPISSALLNERAKDRSAYGWAVLIPTIVLLRTLVFAVGVISVHTVHSLDQIQPSDASGFPWIAFDSHFYRNILINGYPPGPTVPYQIAFFPLFPLAARTLLPMFEALVGPQTASHEALVTVSNICSIIGLCFVYAWARLLIDARTAFVSTLLLALYPSAVFFSAGLTEGLFLMFAALALYLLQKQRLYAAAAVSALASASRPTAVSLAATVVLWTIYYSWNLPKKQLVLRVLLIGMISVAGAASYQCYIWNRYQRFDAFKAAEDKWDLESDPIELPTNQRLIEGVDQVWSSPNLTVTPASFDQWAKTAPAQPDPKRYSMEFFIDRLRRTSAWNRAMALVLLCVLVGAALRRTAVPKLVLVLPALIFMMSYLPNSGLRASSILRYESAGIPLFVVMAIWLSAPRRKPLLLAVGGLSLIVQLYYAFLFSRGFWVG